MKSSEAKGGACIHVNDNCNDNDNDNDNGNGNGTATDTGLCLCVTVLRLCLSVPSVCLLSVVCYCIVFYSIAVTASNAGH